MLDEFHTRGHIGQMPSPTSLLRRKSDQLQGPRHVGWQYASVENLIHGLRRLFSDFWRYFPARDVFLKVDRGQ